MDAFSTYFEILICSSLLIFEFSRPIKDNKTFLKRQLRLFIGVEHMNLIKRERERKREMMNLLNELISVHMRARRMDYSESLC